MLSPLKYGGQSVAGQNITGRNVTDSDKKYENIFLSATRYELSEILLFLKILCDTKHAYIKGDPEICV